MLEGFRVGQEGFVVSHLQFADDTLIMCKDSETQVLYFLCVIRCFEVVSGLKVNLSKSKIFGVGILGNLDRLAECLGYSVGSLPMTYLGLPLGATYKNSTVWNPIISRINKRLAGWKGCFLSKGGRLVLLKSVLASPPTYFLSLLHIPASVERKIEKCQRDFLWGKWDNKEGMHMVAWEDICKPKRLGGLGQSRIRDINIALLSKWLWHFGREQTTFGGK